MYFSNSYEIVLFKLTLISYSYQFCVQHALIWWIPHYCCIDLCECHRFQLIFINFLLMINDVHEIWFILYEHIDFHWLWQGREASVKTPRGCSCTCLSRLNEKSGQIRRRIEESKCRYSPRRDAKNEFLRSVPKILLRFRSRRVEKRSFSQVRTYCTRGRVGLRAGWIGWAGWTELSGMVGWLVGWGWGWGWSWGLGQGWEEVGFGITGR